MSPYVRSYARLLLAVWITTLFPAFSPAAQAQTISMTAPSSPVTVTEGDDYATSILQNPWDFNERRDLGWEEKFIGTQVTVSNGVWRGVSEATPAYVFPLFSGFTGSILAEGLPGDRTLPRFGKNHPVDSNKYSLLSFKVKSSVRDALVVDWNNDPTKTWPANRGARYDGYAHRFQAYTNQGWHGYVIDMKDLAGNFDAGQITGTWSGSVNGLSIHPATFAAPGNVIEFDWVRLADPASGSNVTVSWNASGLGGISSPGGIVGVYFDNDTSGFNGTALAHFSGDSNPGSFTFNSAALPPGDYYFYTAIHRPGDEGNVLARSGYSSRVRVLAASQGHIDSPSQITGVDYATSELANPWDMDSAADIDNLINPWPEEWKQFLNPNFAGGIFSALADVPWVGRTMTDVQVHMNIPRVKPVDTKKYRYFTTRLWVDPTLYPTLHDKIHWGWVFRPIFWFAQLLDGQGGFADGGMGAHFTIYEDWHTYTLDLWDPATWEAGKKWLDIPWIAHLRLDPLETNAYTWFSFDFVQITAEPRPDSNGIFPISLTMSDADSSGVSVALYRDTDKSGADGTLIANLGSLAPGSHTHNWDTSALPADTRYYIYAVLNDGSHTRVVYSHVPMITGQYSNPATPPVAPDPLGRSDLQFGSPYLSPKSFAARGGRVNLRITALEPMMGVESVWAVVSGGPRRIRQTIRMTYIGNDTWSASWKVPVNKDKKKRFRYDFTFFAKDNGGVTKSRRGGAISIQRLIRR